MGIESVNLKRIIKNAIKVVHVAVLYSKSSEAICFLFQTDLMEINVIFIENICHFGVRHSPNIFSLNGNMFRNST